MVHVALRLLISHNWSYSSAPVFRGGFVNSYPQSRDISVSDNTELRTLSECTWTFFSEKSVVKSIYSGYILRRTFAPPVKFFIRSSWLEKLAEQASKHLKSAKTSQRGSVLIFEFRNVSESDWQPRVNVLLLFQQVIKSTWRITLDILLWRFLM